MNEKLIRIYQKKDILLIRKHLLVYGDLSASCQNCKAIDLPMNIHKCPECHTEFKYISFRNVKTHISKIIKLMAQRPSVVIIDFDDYKRNLGVINAENFLK